MAATTQSTGTNGDRTLFWACFLSLVATSFGFILRVLTQDQWVAEFGLDETQTGEILGAGLWPFAISIVLFSLVVDRIGYGKAMIFAFLCHSSSAILQILAKDYGDMYLATFLLALGCGTVEAVVNPVVASAFPNEKTKWLNILHAGWPAGLVLGGIIALVLGPDVDWKHKVAILLVPTVLYALMMIKRKFPVSERVAAGVSYGDMLKEVGIGGALIVSFLMVAQLQLIFEFDDTVKWSAVAALTIGYGAVVRSFGRPMFLFLLIVMIPLASTELGVDSWITPLMGPEMEKLGIQSGWVLVYTSVIMTLLRFGAGSIVGRLSPLGLLAVSSLLAAIALVTLSQAAGIGILIGATLYGIGKSALWPTTLGIVSEQFPRGGAMTLNVIAGVGMLGVGIIGAPFLGNVQDRQVVAELAAYDAKNGTQLHDRYVSAEKTSVFGAYRSIDSVKYAVAPEADRTAVEAVKAGATKGALRTVALLPLAMLVAYLGLMLYFRGKGGYRAVSLGSGGH
jgi:MFS family permease